MACRGVRLIGLDAKVKADIGPLKSEVKGLEWANDGRLYIQLSRHILVASADGRTVGTVQDIEEDGTIIAMAISPSAAHLAASIHTPNDNQVQPFHLHAWQACSHEPRHHVSAAAMTCRGDTPLCCPWDCNLPNNTNVPPWLCPAVLKSEEHMSAQVDVHLLQKELTSDKDAVSTILTSFHQYDEKVCHQNPNPLGCPWSESTGVHHFDSAEPDRDNPEPHTWASIFGLSLSVVAVNHFTDATLLDAQISCLAWDHSGRFLATGDCGEATIW